MASSGCSLSLPTTAAYISSKTQFVFGLKSKKFVLNSRSLAKPKRICFSVRAMGSSASSPDRSSQGIFYLGVYIYGDPMKKSI